MPAVVGARCDPSGRDRGTSLNGGRFSITASLIGALIIQTINTGILVSGFPPEFNLIIKAGIIMVVLTLQSPAIMALLGFVKAPKPQAKPAATNGVTKEGTVR